MSTHKEAQMVIDKHDYPEGRSWAFMRSDGALKMYIVTREGNHGTFVQQAGRVLEVRYNGKTLNIG